MEESRLDAIERRVRNTGRFRAELIALLALLWGIGEVRWIADPLGVDRRLLGLAILAVFAAAVLYRYMYRIHRVRPGDVFTMQYQGWYRIAKELVRQDGVLLVRLYDQRRTERPRTISRGELEIEERRETGHAVVISENELASCEPKIFFLGELSDEDEKLIEQHPRSGRAATVRH